MSYVKRIIEEDLLEKLSASGAVLIRGPKSCGKTATAGQFAKNIDTAKMDIPKSFFNLTYFN